jgi:hypothetical protein
VVVGAAEVDAGAAVVEGTGSGVKVDVGTERITDLGSTSNCEPGAHPSDSPGRIAPLGL